MILTIRIPYSICYVCIFTGLTDSVHVRFICNKDPMQKKEKRRWDTVGARKEVEEKINAKVKQILKNAERKGTMH